MRQVVTTTYYEVANQFQAVKLPYQGTKKNSMIIILPADGQFRSFDNSFTIDQYNTIKEGLSRYEVTLTMPKFSYEWSASLIATLQSLGMVDAFDPLKADFSGINGNKPDLYISDVFHKSFVAVDEKGTEAAAATAIIIGLLSMPSKAAMTINRPFLFFIVNDDTGAILFMGRVVNP